MSGPRYSIIPAAAVVDPRLEGRDLQVLALLGTHTNEDGWCRRSQVKMAEQLRVARSTVQAALRRLGEAEYVEVKIECRRDGGDTRLLLIRFGRVRSYPDWTIWPELKPKRHPGNNKVVVETEYDDAGTVVAQWCPLEGYPSLELVQETRLTYCRWHGGLVRLKSRISKRLASYRVTGPKMPAYPWAVENPT